MSRNYGKVFSLLKCLVSFHLYFPITTVVTQAAGICGRNLKDNSGNNKDSVFPSGVMKSMPIPPSLTNISECISKLGESAQSQQA